MQPCARPAAPAGDEEDEEDAHLIQGSASESAQPAAISEDAEAWVVIAAHIPALQRLTADRDQAVAKEDFCLAESFRNKIAALVKEMQKAAVCLCCFVEAPSAVAREKGPAMDLCCWLQAEVALFTLHETCNRGWLCPAFEQCSGEP